MDIHEKLTLLDQQIAKQQEIIRKLEASESPEFYRTPSSWSIYTLDARGKALECLCELQTAKKNLILMGS